MRGGGAAGPSPVGGRAGLHLACCPARSSPRIPAGRWGPSAAPRFPPLLAAARPAGRAPPAAPAPRSPAGARPPHPALGQRGVRGARSRRPAGNPGDAGRDGGLCLPHRALHQPPEARVRSRRRPRASPASSVTIRRLAAVGGARAGKGSGVIAPCQPLGALGFRGLGSSGTSRLVAQACGSRPLGAGS